MPSPDPVLPDPALYPDVVAAGDLAAALRAVAERDGRPLPDLRSPGTRLGRCLAVVRRDGRRVWFGLLSTGRMVRFCLQDAEDGGILHAETPDPARAVWAAHRWLTAPTGRLADLPALREIHAEFGHRVLDHLVEAHRIGESVAVRWAMYLEEPGDPLRAAVVAAHARPALRQLFPLFGHGWLRFAHNTRPPLRLGGLPMLYPGQDGLWGVALPGGGMLDPRDLAEAADLAAAAVPEGTGPALEG